MQRPDAFRRAVGQSLIAHIIILLVVLIGVPNFLPKEPEPIEIISVEIPRGTGDDMEHEKEVKELPQATIQEQKNPIPEAKDARTTAPQQTEVQPKPAAVNPKQLAEPEKKPPKAQPAVPNSKMAAALASIDKQLRQRKTTPGTAQTNTNSEGSQYGNSDKYRAGPGDPEYIKYRAIVKAKVQREYLPPQGTSNLPKPRAKVRISGSGQVVSKTLIKKSGDVSLDGALLRAIDRASPFPIPPASVREEAVGEGFIVGF